LEIDDNHRFIAFNPGVVPRGKQGHTAGTAGEYGSTVAVFLN
jgi:hypothetical protein